MNQKRVPIKQITEENKVVYDDYYRSGIIDGWEDQDKSYNFSHLFKIANKTHHSLKSASVLDVGCGTGDILPYLFQKRLLSMSA
jgi:ubiquinone/menaquinone biosynthesis C-methylase UbiE